VCFIRSYIVFHMRNRIIKNISVYFLWAAVLAINAHMIIPHDHHQIESAASQENTCPVSNDNSNHHKGFPVHCHAFNDLASEKAILLVVFRNIQCKYFVSTCLPGITSFKLQTTGIRLFEFTISPIKSNIPDLSLLRAPPSLS
jgi:hypothetical protein